MTSIEIADSTAAALHGQARRAGLSLDAYLQRLALLDLLAQHSTSLDEQFYLDAEAERLAS